MCNLFDYPITEQIIRDFEDHYALVGVSFDEVMFGTNRPSQVYPKYLSPVMTIEAGIRRVSLLRWGMPAPLPPLAPGEKPKRPSFLTNVRNTKSGHWRPWLQGAEVTFGTARGGRCLVPARAFAEPDRTTSKPVINRWFARRDGKPFSSPVSGANGPATSGPSRSPTSARIACSPSSPPSPTAWWRPSTTRRCRCCC